MSQSVFAEFLNVKASTVSSGNQNAPVSIRGGAAVKLLQLIEMKGIEAITA